jgi:hypothetical protein
LAFGALGSSAQAIAATIANAVVKTIRMMFTT